MKRKKDGHGRGLPRFSSPRAAEAMVTKLEEDVKYLEAKLDVAYEQLEKIGKKASDTVGWLRDGEGV